MPKVRLPLIGVHTQRGIDGQTVIATGKDQRFVNVIFDLVINPITKKATVWVERRPGWTQQAVISAGNVSTGLIRTDSLGTVVSAFGGTNSTIFDSTTNVGTITGLALHFSETILGGVGYILIRSSDGTGWYYAAGARNQTAYTGDTHTNTTVDGIPSTAGMYSGQLLSAAADIVAGTRILTVDSSTAITLDTAATGTTNDLAITKEPIAKILDADFITTGTNKSGFVEMDGYVFYASEDGYVYHSDINTITAWGAASKIAANMAPDLPCAIGRHKNLIICGGNGSNEFFYNAGNASGSVLSRSEQYFKRIGVLNQRSVATFQDDIYFVASSRDGDVRVERLRNMSIDRISTPQIDRILGTMSASSANIYASAFNLGGYSYLSLIATSSSDAELLMEDDYDLLLETTDNILLEGGESTETAFTRVMIYNIDLNIWFEWDGTLLTFIKGLGEGSLNQIIATSRINTGGKIYTINPSADSEVYQDDGSTYSMVITTSEIDHGTGGRKFIPGISLIGDTEDAGTVLLEASEDGYKTWFTLGTFDLTEASKRISPCGSHEGGRAYKLTHAYNGPCRISALDIEVEIGT